uniref:Plant disease resistance polyprotein-like n=1 Tax=Oryza sativa subsp. japonica TaxID=39947 RepID=Q6YWE9_ORYSJ|nr:plant disease resistance polyprotein-like [Oryza sativa Japonica Group]
MGKKRKGEGVLTGGDGGVRRRGTTEGGRHAADGDRDDLKSEKKEVREEERGHRRRECRPKAADMATLTYARWEWRSGDEPRRRRGGRGGSRPREPDGGDGAVRRRA